MSFFKSIINKLRPTSVPRISCPKCGEIHELNVDAACPKCGTKYKLSPEYMALARKKAEKNAISDKVRGVGVSVAGLIARLFAKSGKDNTTGKHVKSAKLRTLIYIGAFAALCGIFVSVTLIAFSDKEPVYYKTGTPTEQPVFFADTNGIVHYTFPSGKEGNIGKGTLSEYAASSDGKRVYFTFTGFLSPTREYTSNTDISSFLMLLSDYDKLSIISESTSAPCDFVSAGDGEYVYIRTKNPDSQSLGTLHLSVKGQAPTLIANDVRDVAVSPSGRYALISVDDSGASKLMRYSYAKGTLENPGVKNAYPLSIDNKGEYMVYAKRHDAESLYIVSEKNTAERLEIPVFNFEDFRAVVFAADRRSLAIKYSDRTTFYTCGSDTYSTMASSIDSEFCYDIIRRNLNILSTDTIPQILNASETALLPYHYYDSSNKTVYCLNEGTQTQIFNKVIDKLVVSENDHAAFVSDGKLYCGVLNPRDNKLFEMGEFGGKTLVDISPDGKLISYSDSDGNLFTLEYGKTLAAQNMGIKRSVDAVNSRFSDDSSRLLVTSEGLTSVITLKNGSQEIVGEGVIPEYTYLVKGDLSFILYGASLPADSDGVAANGLYLYKNGKSKLICDNLSEFVLTDKAHRIDVTRSDYVTSAAK